MRHWCIIFFLCLSSGILSSCGNGLNSTNGAKVPLVVFAAGSLMIPFQHLELAFEAQYPNIDVQAQYHGSIQVMRHATELHEPIDVVATADASLIPMLMYAVDDPDTGVPYADWYIVFATNELAIAYQPGSAYSEEISSENWYSILTRPDVKVGIPDPRFDAAGYRALMAFALAGDHYQHPVIFTDMFSGDFTYPLGIFKDGAQSFITVPEIVETTAASNIIIRGGSIALIALLESGDLDYSFEYESVILQHGLDMIQLPDELNLGSEEYSDLYRTIQVNLDFQRFESVKPEFHGEQIKYGVTIPSNSPHPGEAALFIAFLLGDDGRAIMEADQHPLFTPALGDGYPNIPAQLRQYCIPMETP